FASSGVAPSGTCWASVWTAVESALIAWAFSCSMTGRAGRWWSFPSPPGGDGDRGSVGGVQCAADVHGGEQREDERLQEGDHELEPDERDEHRERERLDDHQRA